MTARTYRSKPVEVEAIRFTDLSSASEIIDWVLSHDGSATYVGEGEGYRYVALRFDHELAEETMSPAFLRIRTPDAYARADLGDWVIRDFFVHGSGTINEFYPCKPEVFDRKYELVDGVDMVADPFTVELPVPLDGLELDHYSVNVPEATDE